MKRINKSLEESTHEHVLSHPQFAEELEEIAKDIRSIARKPTTNEATIATNFELKLYGQIKLRLHIEFEPIKEQSISTKRHIKKGRIDSRIGALIIEYKQKKELESQKIKRKPYLKLKTIWST